MLSHELVQKNKIQGERKKKKTRKNPSTAHHTSSSDTGFHGPRV